MNSLSVIITAHNNAAVLPRTLQSARDAVAFGKEQDVFREVAVEVVAVDDGSTDATGAILDEFARETGYTSVIHRPRPSSPSCARNTGAAAARGELLYFLDGDDLYLPEHLVVCYWALQFTPQAGFAKTGVVLADPVHPDWRPRIEGSVVLNLCVRRHCHEAVGGFPDYHLFVRHGDGFKHLSDIFYKFEDQFYNQLLAKRFTGVAVRRETVQYLRYPGNSYDRQYEKFRRPFGTYQADIEPEDRLRLRLGEAIIQECLHDPGSSGP